MGERQHYFYIYIKLTRDIFTQLTFLHCNSQGIFLHKSQRRDIFTQWLTMKGHFYTTTHKAGTFLHQYSSEKGMFLHQYSLHRRDSFTRIQLREKGHFYANTTHREGTFLYQYSSQRRDIFTPIQLAEKGHFYTNTARREGTFLHQYSSRRRDIFTPIQLARRGHFYTNTAHKEGTVLHQYSSQRRDIFTPIQLTKKGQFYTNTAHREGTSLHHNSRGTALSRWPQQWRVGQQRWADRLPRWGGSTRPAAWCRCRCWVCPSAASSWTAPPCHRPSTCTQYTVTQVTL